MCERLDGEVGAQKTPIGLMPIEGDLDLSGLKISNDNRRELMSIDTGAWKAEIPDIERHFAEFGDRLPERLDRQLQEMRKRLG
jgi:phosphoenolpyruvate carboxykinase (GTP)